MGVNFKEIRTVVHYGPPRYIEDFVQEIGRAGRDKQPALSLLLYSGTQLRKCDKQMKAYAESRDTCLRKLLLEQFQDGDMPPAMLPHSCCMNSHRKCHCIEPEQCSVPLLMYSTVGNVNHEGPAETARIRKTTQDQKTLLKELLIDYQSSLTSDGSYFFSAESTTGFTDALIAATIQKCKYIFDLDYVVANLPVFKLEHGGEILHMVKDVFEDIDDVELPKGDEFKAQLEYNLDLECGGVYESVSSGEESDRSVDSEMSGVESFE